MAARGELGPDDLVWRPGLADWGPACEVDGLFPETGPESGRPPPPRDAPVGDPTRPPARLASAVAGPDSVLMRAARRAAEYARSEEFRAMLRRACEAIARGVGTAARKSRAGAKTAADYARSDEARDLARRAREGARGGVKATANYLRSDEGRSSIRRAGEHPAVVVATLVVFFALGAFLVWSHPRWSARAKWALAAGGFAAACLVLSAAVRPTRRTAGGTALAAAADGSSALGDDGSFRTHEDRRGSPAAPGRLEGVRVGDKSPLYGRRRIAIFSGDRVIRKVVGPDDSGREGLREIVSCKFRPGDGPGPRQITWTFEKGGASPHGPGHLPDRRR